MISECSCGLGKVLVFFVLGCFLCESSRDHEGGVAPFEGFGAESGFLGGAALM
jgi:hypothetical protein